MATGIVVCSQSNAGEVAGIENVALSAKVGLTSAELTVFEDAFEHVVLGLSVVL